MGDGCGKSGGIFRRDNEAGDTIFHSFRISADVGCNDRKRCRHGLNDGVGETFTARGKDEDVGRWKMLLQIGNAANEMEMIGEIQITDESLQFFEIVGLQHIAGNAE